MPWHRGWLPQLLCLVVVLHQQQQPQHPRAMAAPRPPLPSHQLLRYLDSLVTLPVMAMFRRHCRLPCVPRWTLQLWRLQVLVAVEQVEVPAARLLRRFLLVVVVVVLVVAVGLFPLVVFLLMQSARAFTIDCAHNSTLSSAPPLQHAVVPLRVLLAQLPQRPPHRVASHWPLPLVNAASRRAALGAAHHRLCRDMLQVLLRTPSQNNAHRRVQAYDAPCEQFPPSRVCPLLRNQYPQRHLVTRPPSSAWRR